MPDNVIRVTGVSFVNYLEKCDLRNAFVISFAGEVFIEKRSNYTKQNKQKEGISNSAIWFSIKYKIK